MKIEINDHRKIYTVQKEFNELFPFLKIEFYAKAHTSGGASSEKLISHSSKTLGDCRTTHKEGSLTISPNMSVRDLANALNDRYGLTIKISRAAGTDWEETTATDGWSLEEQNSTGQQSQAEQQTV